MIAMMFEYCLNEAHFDGYQQQSAVLQQLVDEIDGCISIELFTSRSDPRKMLGLGLFTDEAAAVFLIIVGRKRLEAVSLLPNATCVWHMSHEIMAWMSAITIPFAKFPQIPNN